MSGHHCDRCGDDFPSSSNATGGTLGHLCDPVEAAAHRVLVDILDRHLDEYAPGDTPSGIEIAYALIAAGVTIPTTCHDLTHRWATAGRDCQCGLITLPNRVQVPTSITLNRSVMETQG